MRTVDLQEQEIFLQAIEIESRLQRKDFVFQACGMNTNLRQRVEKLLDLQEAENFILDQQIQFDSVGEITTIEPQVSDLSGTTIGNYNLVKKIGSGGMGDVYLAEQWRPIRRRVAVKIVKLGMDTTRFLERFALEQQALALMDHHGITKVFDAGATESGRPYFVMELVSGEIITQYCDEKRMNIQQRIELFIELCNAIQHAHQRGIIHRDLKPSNIIVAENDGRGCPKVIDFGVSKANLDRSPGQTNMTQSTCMIGTPEYMSPEQTDTQVNNQDIRTDIYSLGAILCELLTGTTPFENEQLATKSLLSVREIIQTRKPLLCSTRLANLVDQRPQVFRNRCAEPRELTRQLRGNLDAIVEKCLNKDREERYSSAAELIADLRKHVNHQPLEISTHRRFDRWRYLLKTNRANVATALIAFLVVVSLAVLCTSLTISRNKARANASSAEALSRERSKVIAALEQELQIRRAEAERDRKGMAGDLQDLQNEKTVLLAIARFHQRLASGDESFQITPAISAWLKKRINTPAIEMMPTSQSSDDSDIAFLRLWLEEQERSGNSFELQATTLDWIGERQLGKGDWQAAIDSLQQSLYLRTENVTKPSNRIWTLILLSRAHDLGNQPSRSQARLKMARRLASEDPQGAEFRDLLELD